MNGRFFSGRRVEASYQKGKITFKRSDNKDEDEDDDVEKKRLDEFAQWLEKDNEQKDS